ncbi:MAG: hypothetical protein JOZ83_12060 [Silvibacterium sp.]|nr:hypothetical protein [Silvibacterium sp.]
MLRNYVMPGVALILLAIFALPRATTSPATSELGAGTPRPPAAQQSTPKGEPKAVKVPQIGSGRLLSADDVCGVATYEMQQKLGEFGLSYADQSPLTASAEAMIALVPDPLHTHLALRFDRTVDVIQQALQDRTSETDSGWVYTSQWLPWDPVPYQASQDPIERTNIHAFDADRECAPGFLLFRRNRFQPRAEDDKFLVVFLVGESPTSGILHHNQFVNAVRGWRALEGREAPGSTLRIVGPSFSGSLPTLDALLQSQLCATGAADRSACFERAQVVSGTVATSRSIILDHGNFPGLKAANFLSMSESSDAVQTMLANYFRSAQHLAPSEIAFVSEDETSFGNLLSSIQKPGIQETPARPVLFHYPREISQLRNAYEKNSIFSRQSGQQNNAAQAQQELTLSLEDRHEEEDSVPSFSSSQNPVSEESVLSEMTRAMDRQRVRIAVISGTDILDVIFVARYLTRTLPNLHVVLLNTDLLFERSPDVSYFRGMLLANTYPLIPDNMQWTGRFLRMTNKSTEQPSPFGVVLPDRIFSSFETAGVYNAVRLLELAPFENDADIVHLQSGQPLWLAEYSDPFRGGNRPPLWLSAVGRGGFWPVALLDRYSSETRNKSDDKRLKDTQTNSCGTNAIPPAPAGSSNQPPTSLVEICAGNEWHSAYQESIPVRMFDAWLPTEFTIAGISIHRLEATQLLPARLAAICLLALFILFGLILCGFAGVERWPQYRFGIRGTNSERRAWIVLLIILAYSWIARLLILDLPGKRFYRDPLNCGLLFLELVLLLFAVWLITAGLSERRRCFWATLLIALSIFGQVLFRWVKPPDFAASLFYLYRSQHLFSGVSPVLPIIFLCIAVICLVSRHIHSLLIFSPRLKPRMPCYQNQCSPLILHFVTAQNVIDMLRACYSPWRMLTSKLIQIFRSERRLAGDTGGGLRRINTPAAKAALLLGIPLVFTLLMLVLSGYLLFPRGFETFETRAYSILLSTFVFVAVVIMLIEIAWVILMWVCLHKGLLAPLERTTLRACFSRVSGFSWRRMWFSIDPSPDARFKPLSRAYESMRRMEGDPFCPDEVKRCIAYVRGKHESYTQSMASRKSTPDQRLTAFSTFQRSLSRCATLVIEKILSDHSRQKDPLATSLDVPANQIEKVLENSAKADSLEANAEEFVGLIYIYAIQQVLLDIRSHILAFTFSYFFVLMALNSYPVAPRHSIMVLLVGLFVAFVIVVVTVFAQMHRDAILSRTTSTEPGKLDLGFYEKLISVLGVPLIGLLASEFPEISNFLFSWLEPSLQTLK